MAKDIQWMGAIFPDVPSITLPQQGGGLASFDDTSDGDIQPADVAQGKIGYAQGQRVVGTATPSTPTIQPLSVTENGTYTAPSGVDGYSPVTVNVPGIVPSGSQTYTENGTYDVTSLAEAVINVAGGGALTKKTIYAKTSVSTKIVFTGLLAEPKAFIIYHYQGFTTYSQMPKYIICMDWIDKCALTLAQDGSNIKCASDGIVFFGTVRATAEYDNGTLTITITNTAVGQFRTNENYKLVYLY